MKLTTQTKILAVAGLLILVFAVFYFWPEKKHVDVQPQIDKALDSAKYYAEKAQHARNEREKGKFEDLYRLHYTNYEILQHSMGANNDSSFLQSLRARNRSEILDSIAARSLRDSPRR